MSYPDVVGEFAECTPTQFNNSLVDNLASDSHSWRLQTSREFCLWTSVYYFSEL